MNNKKGSVIKEIRKIREISQQRLGVLIGSQSMVSRIENNKTEPTDHTILLLCDALNISFEEYFSAVFGKKKQLKNPDNCFKSILSRQ
ncbi:helix-turn-helix transcriptional regulator [Leuconostoc mesenteroides subsp. jonggajibkimchii]|uniref:helix-turn-helix transcriptional regulator n=2 Tax=Leuconostoc mesenteroides TaxID=1245 RepID=UPI003CEA0553